MTLAAAKIIRILLLCILFLTAAGLLHAQTGSDGTPVPKTDTSIPIPDLADIIPLAGELAGSLARLENNLHQMPDVSPAEKDYAAFKAEVDNIDARLQLVKASDNRRWSQLVDLSKELQDAQALAWDFGNPMARKINQLAGWKAEWLAKKKNWLDWESRLLTEQAPPQLKAVFSRAGATIGAALELIMHELETMLQLQTRDTSIRTRMAVLDAEINNLIAAGRRDYLLSASPPMYSPEYFSQFPAGQYSALLFWPGKSYLRFCRKAHEEKRRLEKKSADITAGTVY